MAKRQIGIFYIDANKAYFYGSNVPTVLQIEIPGDTMSYSDVINKDKFYQLIQSLVTTNKIEPVPLAILFSPYATYEKDLMGKTPEEIATDSDQFLDAVPYERVLSRVYKLQDKSHVTAVNKDMYEAIKHAFERLHFSTVAVVALPFLQKVMPDLGANLNLEMIANKFDGVKQYSLITVEEMNNPNKSNKEEEKPKSNPLRLYGLISVFVVLIGILIIMVIGTLQPTKKPVVVRNIPVVTVAPSPTLTPFPTMLPTKAVTPSQGSSTITPIVSKTVGNTGVTKQ